MTDDKNNRAGSVSSNIEEILQQRQHLEEILQAKFKQQVTILFTDICGYTEYIDSRGDIDGRALLLKHNRIVLPLIEKHEGRVVEIIGDAVMAAFSDPLFAIKASVAVQGALNEYNLEIDPIHAIRVKIGINLGNVLVDEAAVYQGFTGDVANVASRVQSEAGPNEILISESVYERVRGSEDIICRFHGSVHLKGKTSPVKIYRVVWRDEDVAPIREPKVRLYEPVDEKVATKPLTLLHFDVYREGDRIKISARELVAGEESTVWHYEYMRVSMQRVEKRCREMVETLSEAYRGGVSARAALGNLTKLGQMLHDEILSTRFKEKLQNTNTEYLRLSTDDQLIQIPWELLNDGRRFLCERFNMGRLVKTRQRISASKPRILGRPFKMLILVDPEGDLTGANFEGTQLRDYMDQNDDLINVSFRSRNITPEWVKETISNFDYIHFAGHAEYNPSDPARSGWRLTNGNLTAQDISHMAGTRQMPVLVFSNACQSARTEKWKPRDYFHEGISGLANAFLLAGAKHYVGSFLEILDEPSSHFALEFYKNLLAGKAIGEAMRLARQALIKEYGEETTVWASYVLYGDPTSIYLDRVEVTQEMDGASPVHASVGHAEIRTQEELTDFAEQKVPRKKRAWWVAVGIILLANILILGYSVVSKKRTARYEKAAQAYYREGKFEEALNACDLLEKKTSKACLAHLIRANIYLREGKLDTAERAYQKALSVEEGTALQRAQAFTGLGRIASLRKQPDTALKHYQQASTVAPDSRSANLSQALVLKDMGKHEEALELLVNIQKLAPEDRPLAALTKETRDKVALARDQERQERIDRLVQELLAEMDSQPEQAPSDGWTSIPLTIWVMEFTVKGYSLQEGEERLLVAGISDQVIEDGRLQLVERALLEKLLQELKLGTSKLIDRNHALTLGRILAARLMLSGQVLYSPLQTQVSIRIIETETGRVTAAVNESFGNAVSVATQAEMLSVKLLEKLANLYPLRGRISKLRGEEIELNVGRRVGVRIGQQFKVIEKDVILEAVSIQSDTSLARVIQGQEPLQEDLRVEARPVAPAAKTNI